MADDDTQVETPPPAGDEPVKPQKNEAGEWECPECGESFAHAIQLGAHRKQKHGVSGSSARTQRRRRSGGSDRVPKRQDGRKIRIRQALLDLANLSDDLRGRTTSDLPEHLADVIRRDADQLATMLAALAERVNPVKFFVDRVLSFAAPVTASSGVLRWLLRAWRAQLEERAAAAAVDPNEWSPEMGDAPWRQETGDGDVEHVG